MKTTSFKPVYVLLRSKHVMAGSSRISANLPIICLLVLPTKSSLWLLIVPNQELCSLPVIFLRYHADLMP